MKLLDIWDDVEGEGLELKMKKWFRGTGSPLLVDLLLHKDPCIKRSHIQL